MSASAEIVPFERTTTSLAPIGVKDLLAQVTLIQQVLRDVMKENQHFGKVPGCGDKPALFKPGAEKLCFVFRLAPSYEVIERALDNGHREYRVKCRLETIGGRMFVGEAEGIATTMEGKYRFRTGPKKLTGKPVPKEYWDLRESNPSKAQELLGGPGFATGKNGVTQQWEIVQVGERVEHDNPADYFNTVVKMAQKRAFVAVTLTATAASDIFTQDLEDLEELNARYEDETAPTGASSTAPAPKPQSSAGQSTGSAPTGSGYEAKSEAAGGPAAQTGSAWRSFIVPKFIKKHAGTKLGDMPENDLVWWAQNYKPKPYGRDGVINPNDLALRKALDQAIAEMREHAGETAKKIVDNLSGTASSADKGQGPEMDDIPD